jgi:AcrR family transcriptional regulator
MPAAQRREHLLDAALSVLAREGYDKVTVDAIAREAGVTRPVVYDAYGGLEPLLHALLDRSQRRALASVLKLMPEGTPTDIDHWILDACAGLIDAIQAAPDVWRPILGLTRDAPELVRARIDATKGLIHGYISDALQTGLEQRGGPYLDTDVLAHLVIATGEHFGRLILDEPEKYPRDRLLASLSDLLTAVQPPAV